MVHVYIVYLEILEACTIFLNDIYKQTYSYFCAAAIVGKGDNSADLSDDSKEKISHTSSRSIFISGRDGRSCTGWDIW